MSIAKARLSASRIFHSVGISIYLKEPPKHRYVPALVASRRTTRNIATATVRIMY
jgi:hypothetical protein